MAVVGACAKADRARPVGAALSEYRVVVARTLPAGLTQLTARNSGAKTHELVVVRTDVAPDALPTTAGGDVDEKAAALTKVGEVEDVASGRAKSLRVTLRPGRYVMFCNEPGHYRAGMTAGVDVQ